MISVIGTKGSPGVTSGTLITASILQEVYSECIVLEADPAGGDLALRFQMSLRPGLITLTAERKEITKELIRAHLQIVNSNIKAMFGTQSFEQFILVEAIVKQIVNCFLSKENLMVIDLGRWVPCLEMTQLILEESDLVLLVVDCTPKGIVSARSILGSITSVATPNVALFITGNQMFDVAEVQKYLNCNVIGVVEEVFKVSELLLATNSNLSRIKSDLNKSLVMYRENLYLLLDCLSQSSSSNNQFQHDMKNLVDGNKDVLQKRRLFRRFIAEVNNDKQSVDDSSCQIVSDYQTKNQDDNDYMELVEE